jgi:putative N6-adenine-specific DNA methylase
MSKIYEFFLICPLGFEKLLLTEIKEKVDKTYFQGVTLEEGGVTVHGDFELFELLSFYLKIPTNILLRIESFKARDLPKIYNKLIKASFKKWLYDPNPYIKVSCKNSRIIHSQKVSKTFQDAYQEILRKSPIKETKKAQNIKQTFHLRMKDDIFSLSLQTTQEPLYKRHLGTTAIAPLRENFAAALYYFTMKNSNFEIKNVLDPMCGSGTFLSEIKNFYAPSEIDLTLPKTIKTPPLKSQAIHTWGNDLTSKLAGITHQDAFELTMQKENLLVICNPPYGERIKLTMAPNLYYKKADSKPLRTYQCKIIRSYYPNKILFKYKI